MIGHREEPYRCFGWAAARADDLMNLIPARIAGALIALVAGRGWRVMLRDAGKHASPNSGWPEAAMAGALGLRLNGPKVYGDTRIEDAWMGDGRAEVNAYDIDRALRLYRRALLLIFALLALVWLGLVILAFG